MPNFKIGDEVVTKGAHEKYAVLLDGSRGKVIDTEVMGKLAHVDFHYIPETSVRGEVWLPIEYLIKEPASFLDL